MPRRTFRAYGPQIALALAGLLAVLPMLWSGPSCGHDFDFHVLSWLEAGNQFAHFGYPHWAYTPAFNAGEPRFVFYPPMSWALGGVLGLALPWTLVPAAFTWVALTLSGVTMHRLARRYCGPQGALLAATLYLANPYMLFTAYERTAYGELLAAAWLPLVLAAGLAERVRIGPIAVAIALVWLTNAPAGVMASYALALVMVVRLVMAPEGRFKVGLAAFAGTLLGFGMAAFYILPAAYEQRFVQVAMAVIPGMRPQDHFLFHRMGTQSFDDLFHDDVVRTASIVALLMLAGIVLAMVAAYRRRGDDRSSLLPLGCLAVLIGFLLTPVSLPLWEHLPKLAFLQFPWRLTALLGVILATAVAIALKNLPVLTGRWALGAGPLLALLLVLPAWHLFHQRCDAEDTVAARVALFHSNRGTEGTDEYTPAGVDGDSVKPGDPPYWILEEGPKGTVPDLDQPPPPGVTAGQSPDHLKLTAPAREFLVLNRRAYPFWRVTVNGRSTTVPPNLWNDLYPPKLPTPGGPYPLHREDDLMVVELPPGEDRVDIDYRMTYDEELGICFSVMAAALVSLAGSWKRRSWTAT